MRRLHRAYPVTALVLVLASCPQPSGSERVCDKIDSDQALMAEECPDSARAPIDVEACTQALAEACTPAELEVLEAQLECDPDPCVLGTSDEQDCLTELDPSTPSEACSGALHQL